MPKMISTLTDTAVRNIKKAGLHSVGGATGLKLQVSTTGARSWILRATFAGKVRDIGLGGYPDVSLKGAREAAREARNKIQQGIDPVAEKREKQDLLALKRASRKTFSECAEICIVAMEKEWTNRKSEQQWRSSLATYAMPTLGNLPVSEISTEHVLTVLEPIWSVKTETATRLRGRIEKVLSYATTRGYRKGDNPAIYKGHLDTLLPAPSKLRKIVHQPALDYNLITHFMGELRQIDGTGSKALEFLILTSARSAEVRGAKFDEIDFSEKRWSIPAERMKAKKPHVVPLSTQALSILKNIPRIEGSGHIFPGMRGGVMSDMTLSKLVKRMHERALRKHEKGYTDKHANGRVVTPHGFRSTFRDWAGEQSPFPREVIEHALAHQLQDKAEAAYQRKTSIPKRILLMQAWANYVDGINQT